MRLSAVHKEILLALYRIHIAEKKGNNPEPAGAITLFTNLNMTRQRPVAVTDFRRACYKLIAYEIVERYRDETSQKFVFRLTAQGVVRAASLYFEKCGEHTTP